MVLCDALVSYLETTFMKPKEGEEKKSAPAPTTASASAEFGGMKMVMKKRSDEDFIMGKKKGRGPKKVTDGCVGLFYCFPEKASEEERYLHHFRCSAKVRLLGGKFEGPIAF